MCIKNTLILVVLSLILQKVNTFRFNDCSYDDKLHQVAYICGVPDGQNFRRRTTEFLYCNNYLSGIDRRLIQILSFPGCKSDKFMIPIEAFTGLRVFNTSRAGLKSLPEDMFKGNEHLEKILLPDNILEKLPLNLFRHTPELRELNLTKNVLSEIDASLFTNVKQLRSIDLSGNWISQFEGPVFSNLSELEFLDISGNLISFIETDLFKNNKKLKHLHLNNNLLAALDCELLKNWSEDLTNISINTMQDLDASCVNDTNLIITIEPIDSMSVQKSEDNIVWTFSRDNFERLQFLNVSGTKINNISILIEEASIHLVTLDLSYQFVGELKATTFQRFINLKHLYLKHTNLTNFEFATFYHQRKLETLDISHNRLKQVDFSFFLRNFQNLAFLNLEGNELKEIDTITPTHFPKLSNLAISKNDFSCEYLAKFLRQWNDLELTDNPSGQTHIGGVDCIHHVKPYETKTENHFEDNDRQLNDDLLKSHLEHMSTIKTLLIVVVVVLCIFCLYFVVNKYKTIKRVITDRLNSASMQRGVVYNQRNDTSEVHRVSLLDCN